MKKISGTNPWSIPICVFICFASAMRCSSSPITSRGPHDPQKNHKKFQANLKEFKPYEEECTSCHLGYLPAFLPERSWVKLMGDLDDHFGQNASLEDAVHEEILKYLKKFAADSSTATARSKRLAAMVPEDETPIRITETPFWRRKHGAIKAYVWKRPKVESRAKCDACHNDADKGIFEEHSARIPK